MEQPQIVAAPLTQKFRKTLREIMPTLRKCGAALQTLCLLEMTDAPSKALTITIRGDRTISPALETSNTFRSSLALSPHAGELTDTASDKGWLRRGEEV